MTPSGWTPSSESMRTSQITATSTTPFADMASDDSNPFVHTHKEDAARAWKLEEAQNSPGASGRACALRGRVLSSGEIQCSACIRL